MLRILSFKTVYKPSGYGKGFRHNFLKTIHVAKNQNLENRILVVADVDALKSTSL